MYYKNFQNDPSIRLAKYKANEAKTLERYPDAHPNFKAAHSWRNSRYPKPNVLSRKGSLSRSEDGKQFFIDNLDEWTAGDHQDAHTVAKLDHTGWYADNLQDGLIRGAVVSFRNPHKLNNEYESGSWYGCTDSHIFYMPATYGTNYDGATIYNDVYYSAKDCAYRADQLAERLAEDEREHDAQFQAELQIEEAREEIKTARRQIIDLCKEIKQAGKAFSPAICSALTGRVQDLLEERREAFAKIEELKNNPWAAV